MREGVDNRKRNSQLLSPEEKYLVERGKLKEEETEGQRVQLPR